MTHESWYAIKYELPDREVHYTEYMISKTERKKKKEIYLIKNFFFLI